MHAQGRPHEPVQVQQVSDMAAVCCRHAPCMCMHECIWADFLQFASPICPSLAYAQAFLPTRLSDEAGFLHAPARLCVFVCTLLDCVETDFVGVVILIEAREH